MTFDNNETTSSSSLMTRLPSSRPSRRTSCKLLVKRIKKNAIHGLFFKSSSSSSIVSSDDDSSIRSKCQKLYQADESSDFTIGSSSSSISVLSASSSTKSCLKGGGSLASLDFSRQSSRCSTSDKKQQQQRKRSVTFPRNKRKMIQSHIIEPYFEYSNDLWWKKEELDECRRIQMENDTSNNSSEYHNFQSFLLSYRNAREEIFPSLKDNKESPSSTSPPQPNNNKVITSTIELSTQVTTNTYKISDINYIALVKAYQYGYDGLERYCGYDFIQRRDNIRHVVQSIVTYHLIHHYNITYNSDELANFSRPLSACDRFWSCIKGHAIVDRSLYTTVKPTTSSVVGR